VQISEAERAQKIFRNISLGHPEYGNSGVVVGPVVDELKRPSGGVTHSLQEDGPLTALSKKGWGSPPEEPNKPLDMDALNRMFSAVSHIKLR
jgi:hypothetical protein